jgi:hypothetical protein
VSVINKNRRKMATPQRKLKKAALPPSPLSSASSSDSYESDTSDIDVYDEPSDKNQKDLFGYTPTDKTFTFLPHNIMPSEATKMSSNRKLKLAYDILLKLKQKEDASSEPFKCYRLEDMADHASWFSSDLYEQKICVKTRLRDNDIFLMILCLAACYDGEYFYELIDRTIFYDSRIKDFYKEVTVKSLFSSKSQKKIKQYISMFGGRIPEISPLTPPKTVEHVYTIDRIENRLLHPDFLKKIIYHRNMVAEHINAANFIEQQDYSSFHHNCDD